MTLHDGRWIEVNGERIWMPHNGGMSMEMIDPEQRNRQNAADYTVFTSEPEAGKSLSDGQIWGEKLNGCD